MSWRLELHHIRLDQNLNALFRHVVHSRLLNDLIRQKNCIYPCDPPPSNSGRTRLMDDWVAIHFFQQGFKDATNRFKLVQLEKQKLKNMELQDWWCVNDCLLSLWDIYWEHLQTSMSSLNFQQLLIPTKTGKHRFLSPTSIFQWHPEVSVLFSVAPQHLETRKQPA